jgi:hypothetical protein
MPAVRRLVAIPAADVAARQTHEFRSAFIRVGIVVEGGVANVGQDLTRSKCLMPFGAAQGKGWGGTSMMASELSTRGISELDHHAHLRRALIASTIGTTIEWYDFLLYGQVTALDGCRREA